MLLMAKPPPKDVAARRRLAHRVVQALAKLYPAAKCSLDYNTPVQLLVATILSAQCTDERVNKVTPALFARYPDAPAFAGADLSELERMIQSTGFFRNKAKNILACCRGIVDQHDGRVPGTMEALHALPGVGRKTANVVLGNAFGVPGLVVDTHVQRLSSRLGLTSESTPERIEQALMALLPPKEWVAFGHRMIEHGRKVCQARKPRCDACTLAAFCPKIGVKETGPLAPKPVRRGSAG
jgi:endonuclease-3